MKIKRIYFLSILFITLVSVLLFTTSVQAATLEVGTGKPYATIQAAINAANASDTVLVYPGTYSGPITFNGKAITVESANGPASTIINGNASVTVVTFDHGEGAGSVLDGFTITNGYATWPSGGGIRCDNYSSPTITNCTIIGNTAKYGGGIFCYVSSSPTITNCTITGNTAYYDCGGGIGCDTSSSPTITNCTIIGNTANLMGGGIFCYDSSPTITNCTITGNTANTNGGGIACDTSSSPTVKNSLLWGDTASVGDNEIYLVSGSTITVTYSDVEGGWTGTGNINADPLFVGNGNYHLMAGSPCIDAGTAEGAPSNDIDGNTRPQGAGYDIGSDEYTGASTTTWSDLITTYNDYVAGKVTWNDVIATYNKYVSGQ